MKKFKKQGGFTLVEMLIVVAIIAILIAISIPMINNALDRAKHATDAANERSAKAEILINYLADGGSFEVKDDGTEYYYDAAKGSLENAAPAAAYGKHGDHEFIKVSIDDKGVVTIKWYKTVSGSETVCTKGLCGTNEVSHS